jgi:hypothetical protein
MARHPLADHAAREGLSIQVDEVYLTVSSQEGGQVQVVAVPSPEDAEPAHTGGRFGREKPRDFRPMACECVPVVAGLNIERDLTYVRVIHGGRLRLY